MTRGPTAHVPAARPDDAERLAVINRRLRDFAQACPDTWLYGPISAAAATDAEVARLLLAARPGQERPVLLLAAIHDVVLRLAHQGIDSPAIRWYPSAAGPGQLPPEPEWANNGGPWPDVRDLIVQRRDEITEIIATRTVQTNEVNRSAYVLAMLALAAPGQPVGLVELGASAGLLLTPDQYSVSFRGDRIPDLHWGDADSQVKLGAYDSSGEGRGVRALTGGDPPPPIVARVGLDLDPVLPDDQDALRWLTACLWPRIPYRLERFVAAVAQRQAMPAAQRPRLMSGSLTDTAALTGALDEALQQAASRATDDPHLVVMTSWTMTYVQRDQRPRVADVLADFAANTGLRVSWCSAEPAGAGPGIPSAGPTNEEGTTLLGVRSWDGARELPARLLGTADPHGLWLDLYQPRR